MATGVISVRVDQELKNTVSALAQEAGTTLGDVIKQFLEEVARSRTIPMSKEEQARRSAQHRRFEEFMAWRATLPPCPELEIMTDEQMRDLIVGKYV